ncbi:MAG: diacylglycerol/lipid kinase family protein [Hyphomonas sp.]
MKLGIIVNEKSGSVPEDGRDQLQLAIVEAGHMPLLSPDLDADLYQQVEDLVAGGAEAIAVWGGDGTICAVLQSANGKIPVLVLPGGTMNLLPKRLHDGELDWKKVVQSVLENPKPSWISAGEVGGQRFYVAALFGQLTHLGASREAVREGSLMEAVSILTDRDALDIETNIQFEVDQPGSHRDFPGTAAAVMPADEGGLEIAVIAPDSRLDLAASAMDALVRGWRESAHFHADGVSTIRMSHAKGELIPATIDGEPCEPGVALTISYIQKAACVLVAGGEA